MNSYTLSNWNGSQDPIAEDALAGNRTSDANGVETTPKGRNKRAQGDFSIEGGVSSTSMGVSSGQNGGTIGSDDSEISLNSLFDDDRPVDLASPISKRLPTSVAEEGKRGRSEEHATSEGRDGRAEIIKPSSKVHHPPRHPRPSSEPRADLASVHTEDAEGEDDDEEGEVIELTRIPSPKPPPRRQPAPSSSPPLRPNDSLFTPPPKRPRRKRYVPFVEVPPFPKGKLKDYKSLGPPKRNQVASSSKPKPTPSNRIPAKPRGPHSRSVAPKAAVSKAASKPGIRVHSSLADAYNLASAVNAGSSSQASPPRERAKKRKRGKDLGGSVVPNGAIHIAASSGDEDVPLSQVIKKSRKTGQTDKPPRKKSRPAPSASQSRSGPAKVTPPKPPPPTWHRDVAQSVILLHEVPFEGSNAFDTWMNGKGLIPASQVRVDEDTTLLASNQWVSRYPIAERWSREALRRVEGGSDDEYSLGGDWSDDDLDEDIRTDFGGLDKDPSVESEEPFDDPSPPLKRPTKPQVPKRIHPDASFTTNGTPRQHSSQGRRPKPPSYSPQTPRTTVTPLELINDSPIVPSQKALGKRRADLPLSPLPSTTGDARSRNRMNIGNNAMVYRQFSPAGQSATHLPLNIYRGNQDSDVTLASLSALTSPQGTLGYESHMSHIRPEDAASEDRSLYLGDTVHTSLESSSYSMTTMDDLWGPRDTLNMDGNLLGGQQYRLDTINPSLLQQSHEFIGEGLLNGDDGGLEEEDHGWTLGHPDDEGDVEHQGPAIEKMYSPAPSASSSRSSTPLLVRTKRAGRANEVAVKASTSRRSPTSPSIAETDLFADIPLYKSDSDDEDYEGSDARGAKLGRGMRKKRKTARFDMEWQDGTESSDVRSESAAAKFVAEEKKRAVTTKKIGPPKAATKLAIGPPRRGGEIWEKGDVEEYCHQCRRKTPLLKMSCAACPLKFCNRCISLRYLDIVFALKFPVVHPCPKCTDICNCTACCKKRGEVYVSSTRPPRVLDSPPEPYQREKRKPKPVAKASSSKPVPPVVTSIVVQPSSDLTFMGPFYALDGSKMQVRVADVVEPVEEGAPEVPIVRPSDFKPRRVFIGRIQPSWGFGPQPQVTYLDPPENDEVILPDRIDHENLGKKLKLFVGKKPRPPPPPPVYAVQDEDSEEEDAEGRDDDGGMLASDGLEDPFLSPLTSLPDTELPCVGDVEVDDGKSHSAESLEDGDLARAIALLSRAPTEPTTPISP